MPKKASPPTQNAVTWLEPKAQAGKLSDKQLEQLHTLEQSSGTTITVQYFHLFGLYQGEARRQGATSAVALACDPDPDFVLELLTGKLEKKPRTAKTKRTSPQGRSKRKKGEKRA
jgi:hypothetical protein